MVSAMVSRSGTWATGRNVYVDRIASAWLIRRHIDPDARFRFVQTITFRSRTQIRFDMYEAESTHLGDSCTFEVLASIFEPAEAAIAAIGETVHDIDLKEDRFPRRNRLSEAAAQPEPDLSLLHAVSRDISRRRVP